jgi:hypothetical protein
VWGGGDHQSHITQALSPVLMIRICECSPQRIGEIFNLGRKNTERERIEESKRLRRRERNCGIVGSGKKHQAEKDTSAERESVVAMMESVIWDCLRVEARAPLLLPMPLQQQQISLDHPSRNPNSDRTAATLRLHSDQHHHHHRHLFFVIVPKHKSSDSGASHAQI